MKIKKIEMINFRQFYGENSIELATDDKNTTIILGNNNSGKTGVYRALMFGLYGLRKLKQDSLNSEVHLVNFKSLEENNIAKATVIVTIETDTGIYIVKRKISASNVQGVIRENDKNEVYLDYIDAKGEMHTNYLTKSNKIQSLINDILDENIKEFFLFDGEKIETLARADRKSRQEVKEGIVKLMEIDKLDKVKSIVRSIYNSEKSAIARKSKSIELNTIENSIKKANSEIEKAKSSKKEIVETLSEKNKEMIVVENELKNNKENIKLFAEKKDLEKEYNHASEKLSSSRDNLSKFLFNSLAPLVLSDYSYSINTKLKSQLLKQKDIIPNQVLSQTLEDGVCLCCNQEISELERNYIEIMQKQYSYSQLTPIIQSISRNLDYFESEQSSDLLKLEENLADSEIYTSQKISLSKEIENLDRQMSDIDYSEKALIEKSIIKKDLNEQIITLKNKDSKLDLDLIDLKEKIIKLNDKYDCSLKQNAQIEYEYKRLKFIKNIDEKINREYDKYIARTRKVLGHKTTDTFKKLIDDKQKSLVEAIDINEKYEITINYDSNINVTQDISQGQQMVVALSFITSLASIASQNKNKLDFPLFMDSPFGRLSQKNRKNLIDNLPNLTNQWIPLLTDSDFTSFEKNIFIQGNRVGKVYKIIKISENRSIIEEITNIKE